MRVFHVTEAERWQEAEENLDGGDELFPHIYGSVPVDAVVSTQPERRAP